MSDVAIRVDYLAMFLFPCSCRGVVHDTPEGREGGLLRDGVPRDSSPCSPQRRGVADF
jgi:hypothetical protein